MDIRAREIKTQYDILQHEENSYSRELIVSVSSTSHPSRKLVVTSAIRDAIKRTHKLSEKADRKSTESCRASESDYLKDLLLNHDEASPNKLCIGFFSWWISKM